MLEINSFESKGDNMDSHVKDYFRTHSDDTPRGNFNKVIVLHEEQRLDWEMASTLYPSLCKGWFELSHLSTPDRIEFSRDFWFTRFPYHACVTKGINDFFAQVEDIGIFITQKMSNDPLIVQMVYSLKNNHGFFLGGCPATDEQILELQKDFEGINFPPDYLAFLQIHNGFSKTTDTGITPTSKMWERYTDFQAILLERDPVMTPAGDFVDATKLIPFYESFGMPFYQCFWGDWYLEEEMGNVYYSGQSNVISDVNSQDPAVETMAFPTFVDWLMFYLEIVEKS